LLAPSRSREKYNLLGLGESHPEDKDELEGVVEGEPVDGTDGALEDTSGKSVFGQRRWLLLGSLLQEGVDNPVLSELVSTLGGME
jgi:hypothetical protein